MNGLQVIPLSDSLPYQSNVEQTLFLASVHICISLFCVLYETPCPHDTSHYYTHNYIILM